MITAELINDHGEIIERIVGTPGSIDKYIPLPNDKKFRCIGFIDPYGDTVFNTLQARTSLITELQATLQKANAFDMPYIKEIIRLAERVKLEPGFLLRFIGD